ncbi:MAG: ThuA domain-containing protein [Mariniblastus sp.]|nr:ThuA domain-containing protein [Mariniblastus sp.]
MKLYDALDARRVVLMALAILIGCSTDLAADEPVAFEKPRMLMLTQSKGYRHGSVNRGGQLMAPAEKAMKRLADSTGLFEIDFSQDAATHITKENLKNYSLVAFYTSGDLPIAESDLKYLLEDWIKKPGHGFLGFHSASDTYKGNQIYWDFIGGSFTGHPWNQNTKVTLKVHDAEHPAMKPFGTEFQITEEIYQYTNWQPEKVRVLMSIDMAKTKLKRPYHVPVAWVKPVGQGHLFYTNLGHRPDTWENEKFIKSIEGAVRWIQGKESGASTPNPDVSAAHHEASKNASEAGGVSAKSLEAERREQELRKALREKRKAESKDKAKANK